MAAAPIPPPHIAGPLVRVLSLTWPVLAGALLFPIGVNALLFGGQRNRRGARRTPREDAAEAKRSLRVPISFAILAVSIGLFVWGLTRLHTH